MRNLYDVLIMFVENIGLLIEDVWYVGVILLGMF